ncbi:uncharacterized protein MONOS_17550 [Monocercomonoides exilis]|uniref:uncharacterized protein n=1 Tax=Monocercomonoides exilis TaxID=2049356 RepID=UPI00355A4181|nr:hypothetical protein MONOS_17550 [Monocercomonoides exilis]
MENKEAQKEVETVLLALSSIGDNKVPKELYLGAIKEIIEYHHENHNLTHLAYQSAWQFLIDRFFRDKDLEIVIVNELHFPREAATELEELSKFVNWKKKEREKIGKETKEELTIQERLKEEGKDENEEAERKIMKMEIFEWMEEEGYEDIITSLLIIFDVLNDRYDCGLPYNISEYFVNV